MAPTSDNSAPFEFSFRTRRRDWEAIKKNPDQILPVVIVGGGIVGAGILREFSSRGVPSVYLFEKNDFASGTSSASSKLIHAGIRYLEQVWVHLKKGHLAGAWQNFRFVLEASNERKVLGKLAPVLIKPKPIYLVLSKSDPRSNLSLIAGVSLYYLMQLFQGQFFPPPQFFLSKKRIETLKSELNVERVKAVFSFWDSETDDARLVIETLQSANRMGGHALNYVELIDFERQQGKIKLTLKNRETGETATCFTATLINATGAYVDEVRRRDRSRDHLAPPLVDRVAGSHIDVHPALTERSYYVSADDHRLVFVLRRDEDGLVYTRIGTTERPLTPDESSDHPIPTERELNYLKNLASSYFPKARFEEDTIIRTDAGIRPLRSQAGVKAFEKSREHDLIEENGVLHVVGVKLTDFRRVSEEIADLLKFPKSSRRDAWIRPKNATRIYLEQSLQDLVDKTMILHWDDFVFRRAGLRPLYEMRRKPDFLNNQFTRLAEILGWSPEERTREAKKIQL